MTMAAASEGGSRGHSDARLQGCSEHCSLQPAQNTMTPRQINMVQWSSLIIAHLIHARSAARTKYVGSAVSVKECTNCSRVCANHDYVYHVSVSEVRMVYKET